MTIAAEMEVAIATNDLDSIDSIHARLNGHCYVDARDTDRLPFRALVTGSTDDIDYLKSVGDVGSYLICRRTIKAGPWEAIGLFPMVHHPDLSHRQSDDHWRDRHAPLALIQHGVMTHYHQLSVVHTLSGTEYDGFALAVSLRSRTCANASSPNRVAVRSSPRMSASLRTPSVHHGGS